MIPRHSRHRFTVSLATLLLTSVVVVVSSPETASAAPSDRVVQTVDLEFAANNLPVFGGTGDHISIKQLVNESWDVAGSAGDIENVDYYLGEADFGGEISASTDGLIQFAIRYRIPETSTLDIRLDTAVSLDVPAPGSFFPGDTIRISAQHQVTGGTISAPLGGGTLDFPTTFNVAAEGDMENCVFGCVDNELFPDIDIAVSSPIVTVPDDLGGTSGVELPPGLPGVSGTVGLPNSEPLSVFTAVGLSSGNGAAPADFVALNFDLDTWVRTPVPLGAAVDFGPVEAHYDVVDVDIDLTASEIQELEFDPDLTVTLPLPRAMAYEVRNGATVVSSGTSDEITFATGHDLYLTIPEDSLDVLEVTPAISAGGRVDHEVTHRLDIVGSLRVLDAGFDLDAIEVFPGIDPSGWVPGGCTPPLDWPCWDGFYAIPGVDPITAGPWGAGFGPMMTESLSAPSFYNPIVDDSWTIDFADSFDGPTLVLDPENKPTFGNSGSQSNLEDSDFRVVSHWATEISAGPDDESEQTLTFTLTTDNDALFAVLPRVDPESGRLTYTPADDAYGTATVTAVLGDGAAFELDSTSTASFQIAVTSVNDAPSFVPGDDIAVLEDAGPLQFPSWSTAITAGPDNEDHQELTFELTTEGDDIFSAPPEIDPDTGDLVFTAGQDANGVAVVTVTLVDDGGIADGGVDASPSSTFVIEVTNVPDAPIATAESFETVEDSTLQVVTNGGLLANDSDADGDSLRSRLVHDVQHGSLELLPTGEFMYEPDPDYHGPDTFIYVASDGDLESVETTVDIVVDPVNDVPVVIAEDVSVTENSGQQSFPGWAEADPGNQFELDQTVEFVWSVAHPELFVETPTVDQDGNLSFTPAPDAYGETTITVSVTDSGIDGDNRLTSDSVSYALTISPVDGLPALDTDDDGVADFDEGILGLNPLDADSDGDGVVDGVEIARGFDPLLVDWSDVDGHTFQEDVLWAVRNGITKGCTGHGAGEFCADESITRGQIAAFLTRAFDLSEDGDDWFVDDNYSLFESNINSLAAAGVTHGCGAETFCPERLVTRGELAAMVARALHLTGSPAQDFFDDDGDSMFENDINRLAAAGITTGCGNGGYCPDRPATRGEVVAFLHRALGDE